MARKMDSLGWVSDCSSCLITLSSRRIIYDTTREAAWHQSILVRRISILNYAGRYPAGCTNNRALFDSVPHNSDTSAYRRSFFSSARFLTFLNNFHRIAWEKAVGSLCFYFLYGRLFCKYLHPNSELINFVWSARWFGNSVAKLRNKLPAQWKLEGKLKDHVTKPLLLETKPFLRCAMA